MPIPIPFIIGGGLVIAGIAWLFGSRSGGDDEDDGEEEQGRVVHHAKRIWEFRVI